jgi:hypothetical protein
MELLYISCRKRVESVLIDELTDKFTERGIATRVLGYGITPKAHDGFLLFLFPDGVPHDLCPSFMKDEDIRDYVTCPVDLLQKEVQP